MYRIWIGIGGLFGFTAVLMAALAAHALTKLDPYSLGVVKSGIEINAWHAIALFALGISSDRLGRWRLRTGILWTIGTILFCTAVYVRGITGHSLNAVAPIGGIALMLGWLVLTIGAVRGF